MRGTLTFLFLFFLTFQSLFAQERTYISGYVTDVDGKAIEYVNVYDSIRYIGTSTDEAGYYQIDVPSDELIGLRFSFTGYKTIVKSIRSQTGINSNLDVQLEKDIYTFGGDIIVRDESDREAGVIRIDPKTLETLPSAGGGVEAIVKTLPGVSSNNELSSQYSVRGGNFDENLVYVSDFEITRPFLIRSGQQEGLSFINSDLVGGISFSAGGFQAKYGDKLSSVLDVTYKKPKEFKGSFGVGILGYSGHLEGTSKNQNLTYLFGARYKSNGILLNALPGEGQYNPSFLDLQAYVTYDITTDLQLAWLGNLSRNFYEVIPDSQTITFGTVTNAAQVDLYFEGQERDQFSNSMNGLSLRYKPTDKLTLKLLSSLYYSFEKEAFDILTFYRIGELETDPSKEAFGEVKFLLGVGLFQDYARNRLTATINSNEIKGTYIPNEKHQLKFGLQYKHEIIKDKLNEWNRIDSAGYSRPITDQEVLLSRVLKSETNITGNRFSGYVQDNWRLDTAGRANLNIGVRFNYWDINKEFSVTPRAQFSIKPERFDKGLTNSLLLRFATGLYYQPPFYRELRNFEGDINYNLKSQKSMHFVAAGDYNFEIWNKPFKFTTEAYYKYIWDLVPYDIDNVLIRYYGENNAKAYTAGIDFRLYGQFVGDTDSWFTVSFLQTRENLEDDYFIVTENDVLEDPTLVEGERVDIGWLRRPTDQIFNASIFFQDYLPGNENIKVHLNFIFGSGLPYGPPNSLKFRNRLDYPSYKRVDIGFSALLFDSNKKVLPEKNPLRKFESLWATLEVLNLLGFENTISTIWVEDARGTQYAAPNRLTNRLVNARLIAKF